MKQEESKEIIKQLVAKADVVTNSFTAGTLERWGLGYEVLKEVKPDIIFMSMPMQGTTGPHKDYSGFGAMMNALIGLNHLTGLENREPIGTGTNYPDHVPNPTHGAFAIMSAIRYRNKTGKGQYLELAQTESALNVLAVAVLEAANNNTSPIRKGNFVPEAIPNNAYPCQGEDRWCVISCETEEQWEALINIPNLRPIFKIRNIENKEVRLKNIKQIDAIITEWTKRHTPEEIFEQLQALKIPAGIIQTAKDLVEHDKQLKARNHLITLNHPEMGETLYNNAPFKMSETPVEPTKAAPMIGADTEDVLKEILGMSEEEIKKRKHLFI